MAWIRSRLWPIVARLFGFCEVWDSMQAMVFRRTIVIVVSLAIVHVQSVVFFSLDLDLLMLAILVVTMQYAGTFLLSVLLLVLAARWAKRCKLAAGRGGFVCPRCGYDLEVPSALDIDPTARPRKRGVGTKTRVLCPECGLEATASDVLKHWRIGPFDPRAVSRRRGFLWPLVRKAESA